jgi:hypothetical protein
MYRLRVRYEAMRLKGAEFIAACIVATEATAQKIKKEVSTYPPVPPNSTYQRTGDLGRGLQIGRSYWRGNVVGIDIGFPEGPEYWQYVVGPLQRPYHAANGWKRLDQVMLPYEIAYGVTLYAIMKRFYKD